MDLVDSIYEASNSPTEGNSLLNELVEKAVENSVKNRPDEFSMHQLYLRDGEIWYENKPVEETTKNMYLLTGSEEKIPKPLTYLFWQELKTRLPQLSKDYIQISPNLLWDKNNGEVITKEEYYAKISK